MRKIMLEKNNLDYYFLFVFVLLVFFLFFFIFCFKMINSFFDHTNFDITQLLRETKMTNFNPTPSLVLKFYVQYIVYRSLSWKEFQIISWTWTSLEIFGFLYLLNRKKTCTCTFDLTLSDQTHNGMYETFSRSTNTIFMRRIFHVRSN